MKFKDLNDFLKDKIYKIYSDKDRKWDDRINDICSLTGKSERTVRKWLVKLGYKEKVDVEIESEQYLAAKSREYGKDKQRFIITWAQNATPIHKKFFKNLKKYAEHINADIHVIAGRYKNPTSLWSKSQENDEWWDKDVVPYLDANRHDLHKYFSIMSDIKIQPTAVNPMSGLQGVSGINSCVFGHPRLQLEAIPVLNSNKPKVMLTTGAVTQKNYTDSKAGKKGEFHHVIGFVILEIKDDETFYVRQVSANVEDGSFNDLYNFVKDEKVFENKELEGIVLGDLHCGNHDEEVLKCTLDFMNKMKPKNVVLHDIFDGYSINHHESKDPFIQYSKEVTKTNDLSLEIDIMMKVLDNFKSYDNVVISRSNHDDFLDRWLKNEDWKKQPTMKNSPLYMDLSLRLLKQYSKGLDNVIGVIPELINEKYPNFKTLTRNQSYKLKGGWEVSQHGMDGPNGSRGSVNNLRTLNTKMIVGHYHVPNRKDGVLSVGTSTKLRLSYVKGPSSWIQSHVIVHSDGKAQHIIFIKDKQGKLGFSL
jgi:hypothetical protein